MFRAPIRATNAPNPQRSAQIATMHPRKVCSCQRSFQRSIQHSGAGFFMPTRLVTLKTPFVECTFHAPNAAR